jgi:hypothetical protein
LFLNSFDFRASPAPLDPPENMTMILSNALPVKAFGAFRSVRTVDSKGLISLIVLN